MVDVLARVTIRVWIGDDRNGVHHSRGLIMSQGFAPPQTTLALRPTVVSAAALSQKLQACFSGIDDPRVARTCCHALTDILVIAMLSVIAGGHGDAENDCGPNLPSPG